MENLAKAAKAVSRSFGGRTQPISQSIPAEVVPAEPPRKRSVVAQCCEGLRSRKRTEDPFRHLTLEAIRADQDLYGRFRQFAEEEKSLENLNFLDLYGQFSQRHDVLVQIFAEHVRSERTNISGSTRRALLLQWGTTQDCDDPHWPELLKNANDEVARLVRDNTLARFKDWLSNGTEAARGPVAVTSSGGPRRLSLLSQEQIDKWERRQSEVARRASTASTASDVSAGLLEQSSPSEHAHE